MTFASHDLLAYQVNGSTNVEACGRERGPPFVVKPQTSGCLLLMMLKRERLVKLKVE
jgi:hypothetical protein